MELVEKTCDCIKNLPEFLLYFIKPGDQCVMKNLCSTKAQAFGLTERLRPLGMDTWMRPAKSGFYQQETSVRGAGHLARDSKDVPLCEARWDSTWTKTPRK